MRQIQTGSINRQPILTGHEHRGNVTPGASQIDRQNVHLLPTPARIAQATLTPTLKLVVPRFNCGVGPFEDGTQPIFLSELNVQTYLKVDDNLILQAMNSVASQGSFGVNAVWSCGPNSAARCAIMIGNPIRNMNWFIDHCPRTSGLSWGIPEPWPKIGPHPDMLSRFLNEIDEFKERQLHSFPHRTDNWRRMLASLERHLIVGRPVIVMLSYEKARQHYVCLVGIDKARQRAAILNTNRGLYEMSLDVLKKKMDAWDSWGRIGDVFARYNSINFEPYQEMRQQKWRASGGGGNCLVM